ncbi:hypothetical protein PoB_005013200 [Plakobranchus ocellatus]|uniref:Secreted protein n=1 Tax=Plakobranchus ocellatus TaxID=259542 RepID=A0AAV4BX21_9GAST|nr:hypothetical protein PoB_005013200 [Plakobranchus ocellatus]
MGETVVLILFQASSLKCQVDLVALLIGRQKWALGFRVGLGTKGGPVQCGEASQSREATDSNPIQTGHLTHLYLHPSSASWLAGQSKTYMTGQHCHSAWSHEWRLP